MPKKIKVVQITHDLAIGGLQQVIVTLCKTINRNRFEVSVLCLRGMGPFAREIEELGIEVNLLPQKAQGPNYFSFIEIARALRQMRPDVIHTHNTQPFVEGTIGALLAGIRKIVHTDHARSFPDKKRYMFAEWLMSLYAYKIIGVSEHTSANLTRFEKINPKKILTIPNGIDGSRFQKNFDKEQKRKELGISGYGPIFGLGVRLSEQKGIDYLIEAMPYIIRSFPKAALIIAGDGPLEESLKRKAKYLAIDRNVFFIGPRLDINEVIQLFEIYILPSLWEGLPMCLLEAMAAGIPIVATNVGGITTAVRDKSNGILIAPQRVDQIAEATVALLSNDGIRKEYGLQGRQIFNELFSANKMTEQYEKIYIESIA